MINVEVVKFLQRILNPNGLQRFLDKAGFPVDLMQVAEAQLKSTFPDANSNGIIKFIKTNFVYFVTGDPVEVTKTINNFLLLDPYVIDFFGYPVFIYTDPAHLRKYVLYAAGGYIGIKLLKKILR